MASTTGTTTTTHRGTVMSESETVTPDPTPSPTPLEIAEQGVDESVSRFISRLHEQIRTLTQQRDRYAAVVEAAQRLTDSAALTGEYVTGLTHLGATLAALEENE